MSDLPKFEMGEWVDLEVSAEVQSGIIKATHTLCVTGILMGSDSKGRTYTYVLAADPPRAYYSGERQCANIAEQRLIKRNEGEKK